MGNRNPHDICTWGEESDCIGCGLQGKLGCRLDTREFTFFVWNQVPSLVIALFGLVLIGLMTGA